MRVLKTIILAFLSVCLCFSQSLDFKHIILDNSTGLPSNTIHEIYQDNFGIIWLATSKNLVKFDGNEYKLYSLPTLNTDKYIHNPIYLIKGGAGNSLWIATEHGFCKFNRYSEKYEYIGLPEINNKRLNDVIIDRKGNDLLCLDSLSGIYNYTSQTMFADINSNTSLSVKSIQQLNDSVFLVSTHNKGLFYLKKDKKNSNYKCQILIECTNSSNLEKAKNGSIWFSSDNNLYTIKTDSLGKINIEKAISGSRLLRKAKQIIIDNNEITYLFTDSLLICYKNQDFKSPTTHNLGGTKSKAIIDTDGNIWTLSMDNGIDLFFKINQNSNIISQKYLSDNCGDYRIRNICIADKDNLFIATHGGGITEINTSNNRCRPYTINNYLPKATHELQNRIVFVYHFKNNLYWVANESMGLYQFNSTNKNLNKFFNYHCLRQIQNNTFIKIVKQDQNKYWFATKDKGVFLVDLQKDSILAHYHEKQNDIDYKISSDKITDIVIDSKSYVWIGTKNGLNQIKPARLKTYICKQASPNSLWSNKINCLFVDNRGDIWIGTDQGLNRYSQGIKAIKRYHHPNIMEKPGIYDIYQDTNNYLWLLYENDLGAYKLNNNNDIDLSELGGYISEYSLSDKLHYNNKKQFIIPTEKGLEFKNIEDYYFQEKRQEPYLKQIVTTNPLKSNELISIPLEVIDTIQEIKLKPSQNTFSIDFTSLDYTNYGISYFVFMLDGFDSKWKVEDELHKVTYANIPPGEYKLIYKSYNKLGKWYSPEKSLKIKITPPFWKKTEFRTAISMLGLFLIFFIPFIFIRRVELQRQELERIVNKRTAEIKKQNIALKEQSEKLEELNQTKDKLINIIAHDLKDPFNQILGFAGLLTKNYFKYDDEKRIFQIRLILTASQNFHNLLENLLSWARAQTNRLKCTPRNIKLTRQIELAINQVIEIANSKNITIVFSPESDYPVYADASLLNIVLRNLITNAIKFTNKEGLIVINAKKLDKLIEISVQDNGIGMSGEIQDDLFKITKVTTEQGSGGEKGTGLGLMICKEIIKLSKGELWFYSTPEQGTIFYFTLPAGKE